MSDKTKPEGSLERQDYDKLRASLEGGNLAARLYAKWLTVFLDGVERFFGDAGMAGRTLFPHAFGLKKPAPLWTAPAFHRCLLLALIYPIATIFLIWAISGHVGPAEAALGLPPGLLSWARGLSVGAIGLQGFAVWRVGQTMGWKSGVWRVITFVNGIVAVSVAIGVGAGAFGAAAFFAFAAAVAVAGGSTVAGERASNAASVGMIAFASTAVSHGAASDADFAAASATALALTLSVRYITYQRQYKYPRQVVFLSLFLPVMVLACFTAAAFLSSFKTWEVAGPLLLFLGLLTLLNAPFDWGSLGLTRALLRRGLELGGWWPYLLALVDACLAGVIIALLALTMVVGVQAFDELAMHGGGEQAAVLPLDTFFDGIAKNPAASEYWWAYALLLSTMIPSLVNLAIAGTALTRGILGLPRLLLLWTPEGRDVPEYKRPFVALGLTLQIFAGVFLGFAAQGFLALVIIHYAIPLFGLDLLDMARAVAAFDLPARIGQLFIGLR